MIAAQYGPVSDIEIAWVVIAAIGLVFSIVNVREGIGDLKWLRSQGFANGRRTLARYQLAAEGLRVFVQTVFIVIGVLSFFIPDPPNSLDLPTAQVVIRFCVTWGLILCSIALTIKSYLGKKVRDVLNGR